MLRLITFNLALASCPLFTLLNTLGNVPEQQMFSNEERRTNSISPFADLTNFAESSRSSTLTSLNNLELMPKNMEKEK